MVPPKFSDDAFGKVAALKAMTQAYDGVTQAKPFLPSADSVLPALLALRKTHRTIIESKAYLQAQGISLENARKRLDIDRANLGDQVELNEQLQKRLQSLQDDLNTESETSAEDVLRERKLELEAENRKYRQDTKKLTVDLGKFIREQLGKALSLELSGGPVVGDSVAAETDGADTGPSQQPRKRKRAPGRSRDSQDQSGSENEADEADTAASTAADELQQMVEDLLSASSDRPQAYVSVKRGSVAAAFLVRSKVAQFHPQDSTRLRLIDFGRELDD